MLFYSFDTLDDFIKSNLISNLKTEIENIKEIINLYENKKANLLSITNNMLEMTDLINKKRLEKFHETVTLLKKSFEDINIIQELSIKLEKDLTRNPFFIW